jgi:26S proteasome regulatory subunit N1
MIEFTYEFFSCVNFLPPPEDIAFLKTAHTIYRQHDQLPEALKMSIRLNDMEMIKDDWNACQDP